MLRSFERPNPERVMSFICSAANLPMPKRSSCHQDAACPRRRARLGSSGALAPQRADCLTTQNVVAAGTFGRSFSLTSKNAGQSTGAIGSPWYRADSRLRLRGDQCRLGVPEVSACVGLRARPGLSSGIRSNAKLD